MKGFGKVVLVMLALIVLFNKPFTPFTGAEAVGKNLFSALMIFAGGWATYNLFQKKNSQK
mgnify:CR=1 FL=1